MKNLLHHIQRVILLALLAGLPSCADEEQETNLVEVNFTATLPADARSRSFGDAEQVNTLIVGVFDEQYEEIYRKLYAIEGTSVNVTLALAQSQTYHFVFWAYDNNQGIYDLSNLKSIQMNPLPDPITFAQAESMDAFFAVKEQVIVKGDRDYTIELVRPLAQINVGTTGAPMLASFTAMNVPDTFRPFSNTVEGGSDYTWNFNQTCAETFSVNGKEYNYLAMGYVFAPTTAIPIATELTLTDVNSQTTETVEFTEVEIEANYRSNIVGQFTAE